MFRFAQHDTLERRRQCAAAWLFEQRAARFLKCRVRDHNRGWRIRRSGVIHPLHFWPERCVFGLRSSNIDWSPNAHQCVKFCCRFTMQPNAAMRVRGWMDIALMKTVRGSKLTPITHWISDVTARAAPGGGYYSAALHAEAIRSRPLVLLLGINREVASRCGLRSHTYINGGGHQASVALHYIDILLGKRNQHSHLGWVVRFIRGDVIRPARAHMASRSATAEQQYRRAGAQQN